MVEKTAGTEQGLEEERREGLGLLQQLMKERLVRDRLVGKQVTYLAHPDGARILDVALVPKKRVGTELAPINIFSRPNCLGIVFRPEGRDYVEMEEIVRA